MSMMLIALSVCAFAIVAGLAVKKQNLIQGTPSLVWFSLMVLPYLYEWRFFPENPRNAQAIGILTVSIVLAIGDCISLYLVRPNEQINYASRDRISNFLFRIFLSLILLVPLLHFMLIDSIPIIDKILKGLSKAEVANERASFGKLLEIPYFVKVLFNLVSNIFGPYCVVLLYLSRKYLRSFLVLVWVLFYSISSSASGPVVAFIWLTLFAAVFSISNSKKIGSRVVFGICLMLILTVLSGLSLGSKALAEADKCYVQGGVNFTPGDILRSCDLGNEITINPVINRLGYRIFLTPVEVSNRWYDYFDGDPSEKRNLLNVFERNIPKQASNKVANWAYVERFPEKYPKSTSANTSVDADAYSFGGLPWIIGIAILMLMLRILIAYPFNNGIFVSKVLQGIGLGLIAFYPVTAPLQAILLPQGFGFIVILIIAINYKTFLRFAVCMGNSFRKFL